MAAKLQKGIDLLEELRGDGPAATYGDVVTYCARIFLRRGEEVTRDHELISRYGSRLNTTQIDGVELVKHTTKLGRRQPIAGIEKSLYGMRKNAYREILVAPHLAYGEKGVPGLIPANALLKIKLWVEDIRPAT